MRALLLAGLLLGPAAALARQPALHDIPWYQANDRVRRVTLQMCHQNASLQNASDDCENAERAEATAVFKGTNLHPLNYLYNPAYWSQNPIARSGELTACDHPNDPGSAMSLPFCAAARQSAVEDAGTR